MASRMWSHFSSGIIVSAVVSMAVAGVVAYLMTRDLATEAKVSDEDIERAAEVAYQRVLDDMWPAYEKMYRQAGLEPPKHRPTTLSEMLALGENVLSPNEVAEEKRANDFEIPRNRGE